jgi:hypothetical protein
MTSHKLYVPLAFVVESARPTTNRFALLQASAAMPTHFCFNPFAPPEPKLFLSALDNPLSLLFRACDFKQAKARINSVTHKIRQWILA